MTGRRWASIALLPLLLAAAACDRHKAPSDKLADSASELVGAKKPEPKPLAQGPYAPRDTCGDLPGAEAFREKLAEAVMARDANAFVALAAEDVKLDFGDSAGRAELKKRLTDKDWMLWDELDQLLALGCADNQQGGLTLPWYFEQHIDKVDDNGMLVTGENVPLLATPDPKGKAVGAISWDVVELTTFKLDDPFQKVTTAAGKPGYIATDKLRSLPYAYRLLATSRNGKWSIVSLVEGD